MKNSPTTHQLKKTDPKNLRALTERETHKLVEFIRSHPEKLGKEAENAEKIIKLIEENKIKLLKTPTRKTPLNLKRISGGAGRILTAPEGNRYTAKIGGLFYDDPTGLNCTQVIDPNMTFDW